MKQNRIAILIALLMVLVLGCQPGQPTSDQSQRAAQEKILAEGNAQVGMPAIKNFRERKLLKDVLELRDQTGLVTYTYLFNELNGSFIFLGETIGYPLPYSTQFTNPQKVEDSQVNVGYAILPQADPNGLFSPDSAEGTWILMKDPNSDKVAPIYCEPRVMAFPFRLNLDASGHIIHKAS